MQQSELPKAIKRAMRALVGIAHETELKRALEELYGSFQEWKSGEIDSIELSDEIHNFHNGPNRDIYLRYASKLNLRFLVRQALAEGTLQEAAVPKEVWPYLEVASNPPGRSTER
jgi:hypothetical protein